MRRVLAVAAWSSLAVCVAAPVPPSPTTTEIKSLIDQLGSDQFTEREGASRALEKLGAVAIPALQTASRSENPEVRERASVLLARLKRAADSSNRLVARRIKLDYKDMPLGTAVHDLRSRTGLPIVLDIDRVGNPLRKITCQTAEVPVWEALELFCQAAGLREQFRNELDVPRPTGRRRGEFTPVPDPKADTIPIVLVDGTAEKLPGDRRTAVRVMALPPNFPGHKVRLGSGEYTLCLDVTPLPGLNWQEVLDVKVSRVIDSSGRIGSGTSSKNPLPVHDPSGMFIFTRPGVAMRFDMNGNPVLPETIPNPRVVPVPIKLETAAAKSLKRLEGAVFGEISLPKKQLVTISDLKKNTGRHYEGPDDLKVTVLEVREAPSGGTGVIRVQFEYPSPSVLNARKRGIVNPNWPVPPVGPGQGRTLLAFDAQGKPFPVATSGYTDFSDDGMLQIQTMQFTFRGEAGLPAKLAVIGPKLVRVEVPFVLENVQLP